MAGKKGKSGRLTRAQELSLSAILDDIGNSEKVLEVLYKNALNPKNFADRQLWLQYKYGKPKETVTVDGEMVIGITRRVVK